MYSVIFFGGGWGLNPGPCIYYALSISIELSSRGHVFSHLNISHGRCTQAFHFYVVNYWLYSSMDCVH